MRPLSNRIMAKKMGSFGGAYYSSEMLKDITIQASIKIRTEQNTLIETVQFFFDFMSNVILLYIKS